MNDKTKPSPFEPLINFFSRYNLIVFIIIIAAGLSIAIFAMTSILQIPYSDTASGSSKVITYDEATISQLDRLNTNAQMQIHLQFHL